MAFIRTSPEVLRNNPFTTIGEEWFLLTSGSLEDYNTMTCSWGAMGVIWNEPSLTAYVRTSRHTFSYLEKNKIFTVSLFPEQYRKALAFCGSHSGKEFDKAKETGLIPAAIDGGVTFEQAKLAFVCEKVYSQLMEESAFADQENLRKFYSADAMHELYIGRILAVYENQA